MNSVDTNGNENGPTFFEEYASEPEEQLFWVETDDWTANAPGQNQDDATHRVEERNAAERAARAQAEKAAAAEKARAEAEARKAAERAQAKKEYLDRKSAQNRESMRRVATEGREDNLDAVQLGIDTASVGATATVVGEPVAIALDGFNALISLGRGDWVGAGIAAAAMIPGIGLAGNAALAGRLGNDAIDGAATASKKADEVTTAHNPLDVSGRGDDFIVYPKNDPDYAYRGVSANLPR